MLSKSNAFEQSSANTNSNDFSSSFQFFHSVVFIKTILLDKLYDSTNYSQNSHSNMFSKSNSLKQSFAFDINFSQKSKKYIINKNQ